VTVANVAISVDRSTLNGIVRAKRIDSLLESRVRLHSIEPIHSSSGTSQEECLYMEVKQ